LHTGSLPQKRRLPAGERVHVYVDVSGSIGLLKDDLYGAVLDCRAWVHPTVHLFSTKVADVSLSELRQGVCKTTMGTSIVCVAEHVAANNIRRAVLLTDGYVGKAQNEHSETLHRTLLGAALTGGNSSRADLDGYVKHWAELPS
jgi:hypothetical protein